MSIVIVFLGLAIPASHQVRYHNVHLKLLRAVHRSHGPEVRPPIPLTPHELAHRHRPLGLRIAADLAWLAWIAGVVYLGVILRYSLQS